MMRPMTGAAALLAGASAVAAQDAVELSVLVDNSPASIAQVEALTQAYTAANPSVTFDIEIRPGSIEGDNVVKTRLATDEMADIMYYNSGSLMQALAPSRTLVPLSEEITGQVNESFLPVVTGGDQVFGVPIGPGFAGGILYNRAVYDELGLEVPMTWDAFMENNAAISEAGVVPVIQTYRDTWTAQLLMLADYFNVEAAEPGWHERYTGNEAKFASSEAALKGFERLQEVYEAGYLNEDFGAASYDDGLRMLAAGGGAHYPMLTVAIGPIQEQYPDAVEDIGFFAQPGDDAGANGATIWLPNALYVPQSSEEREAALDVLRFAASTEGCMAVMEGAGVTGPYFVEGCELPESVPQAVADLEAYVQEDGRSWPALEFLSPVKGPALPQLTVEVGSGIRDAVDAAAIYDEDVRKQALQLGLEGW